MTSLISPDRALELVLERAHRAAPAKVALDRALGLVLAEDVHADRPFPPFRRAMMDGFAVRLADGGKRVRCIGEVAAGQVPTAVVREGHCVEIMTGAPCPEGTEAVVMVEETSRQDDEVTLPPTLRAGQHIAERGSECAEGTLVLGRGQRITPLAIGALAALGWEEVRAIPAPSVAIITTGDELASPGAPFTPPLIADANGPMLASMAREMGVRNLILMHAGDSPQELTSALQHASRVDIVVLSGGVSQGKYDLVPQALASAGATEVFHGVRQKPGKPLLFAVRGARLIFGLPGTPLGSHLGFHRYVAAVLRVMMGRPRLRGYTGRLTTPLQARSDRELFALALAQPAGTGWEVTPRLGQGSSDIMAAAQANAYLRLPPGEHNLDAGREVAIEMVGEDR